MTLLILIVAIAFVQIWAGDNPLHQDHWYNRWMAWSEQKLSKVPMLTAAATVLVPLLGVALVMGILDSISTWLLLPFGVVILLYSFGRGEFGEKLDDYAKACEDDDWSAGIENAGNLGVDTDRRDINDWAALHEQVLDQAAYKGFERMFAVLFWFFLLGPLAALGYRLLFLYVNRDRPDPIGDKILWLMEWPAVRVLGLSFSFTGNFVGCYNRWVKMAPDTHSSSAEVLGEAVLGALLVEDNLNPTSAVNRKELSLLHKLYTRTLWFWLATAALVVLIS